jgi:4-oxalocrotonate tautomerase family enzyme
MPVITVTLIEGYSEATRRDFEERLTDAARLAIGAAPDGITVIIHEVPAANYMRGRRPRTPGLPPPRPAELVLGYLAAMEQRDFGGARQFLGEEFFMVFPGGRRFQGPSALEELAAWSATRYRSVTKSYEAVEESPVDGGAVVHCHGALAGTWLDGSDFRGIRFIDRFTVRDGKLLDQMVWNDLAVESPGTA